MAVMKPILPDALTQKLSRLGAKTDTICATALKDGAEIARKAVETQLAEVVGKGTKYDSRSTGQLEQSLGVSPVRVDDKGNYDVKVGFAEPRSDGDSNAKIANVLEYGKSGQPPKPFLKPAKSKCGKNVLRKMAETLEREMENV